jgi:hypothetical protein
MYGSEYELELKSKWEKLKYLRKVKVPEVIWNDI